MNGGVTAIRTLAVGFGLAVIVLSQASAVPANDTGRRATTDPAQTGDRWIVEDATQVTSSAGGHDYFIVESNSDSDNSPRVRINWRGHTVLRVQPEGGLVRVSEAAKGSRGLPVNRLKSSWIYSPDFPGRNEEGLYLMFGWAFASDPGSLRVVRILPDGQPRMIYSDDTFQVETMVADAQGVELIGRRSLPEAMGACLTTYDPFTVLRIRRDISPKPSVALSRNYNLAHGYVWAGPMPRTDIRVDSCANPARIVSNVKGLR